MTIFSYLFLFAILNINLNFNTIKISKEQNCWYNVTNDDSVSSKMGNACNSKTSLRVIYKNNLNRSLRVAFYLADENGKLPDKPYVLVVHKGNSLNHHRCKSNGKYYVLIAEYDKSCVFPKIAE